MFKQEWFILIMLKKGDDIQIEEIQGFKNKDVADLVASHMMALFREFEHMDVYHILIQVFRKR